MNCKKCGQEIDTSAKFCPHCGAPVEGSEKKKKAKKPFYKRWWFWLIVVILLLGSCGSDTEAPVEDSPATESVAAELPAETTAAVATEETVADTQEIEAPTVADTATVGQKNALRKAHDYLDYTAFSHTGLIDQLEYEGFTTEEATYAADNCGADWFDQAAKKAESYLDYSAFSYTGLIGQLEYEGFTTEQATQAADNCGADWFEQAVKKAEEYLEYSGFSRAGLIEQLEFEGFTNEQAVHGVTENGL